MKKVFIIGMIFGAVASAFGLFSGLQIHPTLGEVLLYPFVLMADMMGKPLGTWSGLAKLVGLLLAMIFWGMVFVGLSRFLKILKKPQ